MSKIKEAIELLEKEADFDPDDRPEPEELLSRLAATIDKALALLRPLADEEPICKTCGDTGKPCRACGEYHPPISMCPPHEVRMKWAKNVCPDCGAEEPKCKTCGGTKMVEYEPDDVQGDIMVPCPDCRTEEPQAGEFTKRLRSIIKDSKSRPVAPIE